MTEFDFDLVVVGGGINGVGVAQAASAAGYRVALLEKSALAAGTSGKSSKLIHGGLRYLESYEFSMVRESLAERSRLLKNAPDLVRLKDFFIPVYRETRRPPWLVRLGLGLYSTLGGLKRETWFRSIPRSRWSNLDGLNTHQLRHVFCYRDAQTDDSMLTRAIMQSAEQLGAVIYCPGEFTRADIDCDGVSVHFKSADRKNKLSCRVLINAAGPWVNQVAARLTPAPPRQEIELTQGTHIVVPGTVTQGIYYMESRRDGRAVFVMPWQGMTAVGTTETKFSGNPDVVLPRRTEKAYLMEVLRHHFPRYADAPIHSAWAGLRVLPAGPGHAFHRSRETILIPDQKHRPRVISIYGGKLTTYRTTALKVVARLRNVLPRRRAIANTAELSLEPADDSRA